jgi:hypothetical protein
LTLVQKLLRSPPLKYLTMMWPLCLAAIVVLTVVVTAWVFSDRGVGVAETASVQQTMEETSIFPGLGAIERHSPQITSAGVNVLSWDQPLYPRVVAFPTEIKPESGSILNHSLLLILVTTLVGGALIRQRVYQSEMSPDPQSLVRLQHWGDWSYSTWHDALAQGRVAQNPVSSRRDTPVSPFFRKTV